MSFDPRESPRSQECSSFLAMLEDGIDRIAAGEGGRLVSERRADDGTSFDFVAWERHRAECAPCFAAVEARAQVRRAVVRMARAPRVAVPADLDARVDQLGAIDVLARVLIRKLARIDVPAELDARVLRGPVLAVRPRRVVRLHRVRLARRMALAAMVLGGVGVALLFGPGGSTPPPPPFQVDHRPASELQVALRARATLLSGGVFDPQKG